MTTENNNPSPFTRRGILISAVAITLILAIGIVVGVLIATRGASEPAAESSAPAASASAASEPSGSAAEPGSESESESPTSASAAPATDKGDSVCGLPGVVDGDSRLTEPPAVDQWDYAGTTAYPTSAEFGPAATADEGYRYCYQHSPEGAVFAAANAVVQGGDSETVKTWLSYFLAEGPSRDALLAQGGGAGTNDDGVRVKVAGFRLLAYDGNSARVDIAVHGAVDGTTVNLSMVYTLVWEGGDWKLYTTDPTAPINVATIPDLSGYVRWSE
ncbi:MAG: hypothetical protein Q4G21_09710 [Dermabacter sp.]|nr:hypothetical protein [Dermabacter sp.]